MANIQNIPLNEKLRDSNPKINQNFQSLNNELTGHINSTSAHKAEDITYTGQVPGGDVKEAIENVNGRISEIVAQSGDDITELVDARDGYPVLGDRLDASDADLARKANVRWFDVKDYGAIGNGVADDTDAILSAIAAIPDDETYWLEGGKTGGILFFPLGKYRVSRQIDITKAGIQVIGIGSNASVIMPTSNFVGDSVLFFRKTGVSYPFTGLVIENIGVYLDDAQNCNGITVERAYDSVNMLNVWIKNVGDTVSALKMIPDPDATDTISQTILLENVIGIHKLKTATAPVFYFDKCQEMQLIGCKAFATWQSQGKANCYPMEFVDCRGVMVIGCSVTFTSKYGMKIAAVSRMSAGIVIDGCTFETCDNIIEIKGTSSYMVRNVTFRAMRSEASGGKFDLDFLQYSRIESQPYSVTVGSGCANVHIDCYGASAITDNGTNTTIFSVGVADAVLSASTNIFLRASAGKNMAQFNEPPSSNTTALTLRMNKGGFMFSSRVEVGAVDSGGTGYRILRVPNS
ncbi:glycosyl hydrolase family 28-related protein [Paenibacillus lautus]|uniref:glycosyl hydrolase family 28-related protein n=1 Tax=Paenibacillus lautus TaxID=1401 RepID=UPI0013C51EAD|nr:glycosyl hydrolase family 28-related protein [Paenibacillus lautus]